MRIDLVQRVRAIGSTLLCVALLVMVSGCGEERAPGPAIETGESVVRVVVVDLHGFVGCGVDADLLRSPLAEVLASVHEAPDAVVFSIDSGGGMLNRVGPLSDLLHGAFDDGGPSVMGWVVRAESAAALVALGLPDLWMPPSGIIGGAVGVERRGDGWRALPERDQQAIRYMAVASAARGGHERELALSLVTPAAGEGSPESNGLVLTGMAAQDAGLVRVALTLEDALDERFGAGSWEIDGASSAMLSRVVREAESIREEFGEVSRRFEIALERAGESVDAGLIEAADSYLGQALVISTREDAAAVRAMTFLDGFAWVARASEELERVSGEGGG